MNNAKESKKNNGMKVKFSGTNGSISFHYTNFKCFENDLRKRVMPSLDGKSQQKLDKWLQRKEIKEQTKDRVLPN